MKPVKLPNGIVVTAPTACQCGQWHIVHLDKPHPTVVAIGRRIKEQKP